MAPPAKKTPKGTKKEEAPAKPSASALSLLDLENDKKSATPEDLKAISTMADRSAELQLQIDEEGEYLKSLIEEKTRLDNVSIPEAMMSCGLESFKTSNGASVEIKPFIQVNLPAAGAIEKATGDEKEALKIRLAEGLKWIEDHDGSGIIKSNIIINFDRGQHDHKSKFLATLQAKGYAAISEDTVHPQTLGAFMKEKMAKGESIPAETFKLYSGTKAVVKLPVKK